LRPFGFRKTISALVVGINLKSLKENQDLKWTMIIKREKIEPCYARLATRELENLKTLLCGVSSRLPTFKNIVDGLLSFLHL
jgi:hypothetical protein